MKNLLVIIASLLFIGGNLVSASEYRINSTREIINTPVTGAGIAEPPRPSGTSLLGPPDPITSRHAGGFIEPPLPEEPIFNYRYIDAGYIYQDMDPSFSDKAGHGARFEVYHDITGPVYAMGNFRWSSADTIDRYGARVGLGGFVEVHDRVHLTLEGGAAWEKTKSDQLSSSDTGYFAGPGFRMKFRQGVEVFGNAYYLDLGEEANWFFRGGVVIDIKPKLDLTLSGEFSDDETIYFAGVRYLF